MRGIFAIGLVVGGAVACSSGGIASDPGGQSDQTIPPTDRQQAPINGTQLAAVDSQSVPPTDPQSVPSGSATPGAGAVGNSSGACRALCASGARCPDFESGDECLKACSKEEAKRCGQEGLAFTACLVASPSFDCNLDAPTPAECAQLFGAVLSCTLSSEPKEPKGTGGNGNGNGNNTGGSNSGRTGGAGTGGNRTGGASNSGGAPSAF